MADLDAADRHLIELLRRDSRRSVLDLARKIGLSRSTVEDGLTRLKRNGIIMRFTIDTLGPPQAAGARAFFSCASRGVPAHASFPASPACPKWKAATTYPARWTPCSACAPPISRR
jgi:hypothetical protein